jgi:hypothetical protein
MCAGMLGEVRTKPISDESLRTAALQIIFPHTQISVANRNKPLPIAPSRPAPHGIRHPDVFMHESVYQVVGKPTNQIESGAAEDVASALTA